MASRCGPLRGPNADRLIESDSTLKALRSALLTAAPLVVALILAIIEKWASGGTRFLAVVATQGVGIDRCPA